MKRIFFIFLILMASSVSYANDAEVLPEGVFKIGQQIGYDWSTDNFKTVFGTGTYPTTYWYNITVKLSDIAPDLAERMECKDAYGNTQECILGTTHFDLFQAALKFNTSIMYGITDKLSAGVIIPYHYSMSSTSLKITGSNMMINYEPNGKVNRASPIVPYKYEESPPGSHPIDANDVATILSDPAFGFEYKDPLSTHDGWYLSDIIFGIRYLFYENNWMKNAYTFFLITPTGDEDPPDWLFSPAPGDGQFDIGFWFNNDFLLYKKLNLWLNFSTGYTSQLPHTKKFRVPSVSRNIPNTPEEYDPNNKGENFMPIGNRSHSLLELRRDIGDNVDFYLGFRFNITETLIFNQEFYYYYKWRDQFEVTYQPMACELVSRLEHDTFNIPYCNEKGADYSLVNIQTHALSQFTDREELVSTTVLTFSTLPLLEKGKFPIPLMFSLGYKRSIAGKNIEQSNSVFMNLDLFGSIYMFSEEKRQALNESQSAFSTIPSVPR
ncbi:MAG: hypothetical protein ACP5QK_11420 [Myxococcota bacterium]